MKAYALAIACASLLAPLSLLGADKSPEVRFCPETQVHVYPAESQRNIQSLVLQNAAVINSGPSVIEVSEIDIELLRGGKAIDTRRLLGPELERLAAAGPKIQASGMLNLAAFQFCGNSLVAAGVTLAGPVLRPNQALLLTYQPFLYKGQRDALRLHVFGKANEARIDVSADLPIVAQSARTRFIFPVTGTWFVAVGPTLHTGHRWGLPEEFGFDLAQLGEGTSSHKGSGAQFADYYAYGATVRAAAGGRVLATVSDVAEDPATLRRPDDSDESYGARVQQIQNELLAKGGVALAGNYVLLDHGNREYSLYAHMQPASIVVKAGDTVASGQALGRLGSSGNSTEPHLHFQVCDRPEPLACAGIPIAFDGVALPYADYPRPLQSGDIIVAR